MCKSPTKLTARKNYPTYLTVHVINLADTELFILLALSLSLLVFYCLDLRWLAYLFYFAQQLEDFFLELNATLLTFCRTEFRMHCLCKKKKKKVMQLICTCIDTL